MLKLTCLILTLCIPSLLTAQRYSFDPTVSKLEVFVPKSGLLSVLGHEHTIDVQSFSGFFEEGRAPSSPPRLVLEIPVRTMRVIDEGVSEGTRARIQKEMEGGKVLDCEAYPQIRFVATEIQRDKTGYWEIRGDLSIRGMTRSVSFRAEVGFPERGTILAEGTVDIEPGNFGIKPVRALGGSVRTASTIHLHFKVTGSASDGGQP